MSVGHVTYTDNIDEGRCWKKRNTHAFKPLVSGTPYKTDFKFVQGVEAGTCDVAPNGGDAYAIAWNDALSNGWVFSRVDDLAEGKRPLDFAQARDLVQGADDMLSVVRKTVDLSAGSNVQGNRFSHPQGVENRYVRGSNLLSCDFRDVGRERFDLWCEDKQMASTSFRLNANPVGMTPSDFMEEESFTTEDTSETNLFAYAAEDDSIMSGVWECAPSKEEYPDGYPVHEIMHVISGSVTLTHPDGLSETFTSGDTFFIAKGSPCIWENTETLRKFYMIAE